MDYNTGRKKLPIPEYGRNIQNMVDHILTIENKEERTKAAKTVIAIMGNMNPHLRDISDFKHKLWDHLAIMSDFKLDIDSPYDFPSPEKLNEKPKKVAYSSNGIKLKHYGHVIQKLIDKAIEFDEGEEKQALIRLIANHMKKSYLTWNKDSVTDELIFEDINRISKGKLVVDDELKLMETRNILSRNSNTGNSNNRRKRNGKHGSDHKRNYKQHN